MRKALFLLFLAAIPAGASVIVDSQTTSGLSQNFEKVTWPMTIGTGINRLLTVGCAQNAGTPHAISSATLDTSTMTFVRAHATFPDRMEMWYLVSPSTGAHTITMWMTGSGLIGGETICGGISFENVNLSSPIVTSSASVTATVTWNVPASSTMLVDVMGQSSNATAAVPGSGQTIQWAQMYSARSTGQQGSTKSGGSTAGDKTMSWTQNPPGVMIAMAINTSTSAPEVTSLSPNTKGIGEAGFTLTVNGSNFVSGASVTWNGSARSTTFVNSTQMTATIPASDIASIAAVQVRVVNPDSARSNIGNFAVTGDITRVWATDGGWKPTQDDTYGTDQSTTVASTRIWNGATIRTFQAKNEINGFALVLENSTSVNSSSVSVRYPVFTHSNGYVISSTQPTVANWHDWRNRPIQVYKVGYLPIRGLSRINWDVYDEQHVPERMQATYSINGAGQGVRSGDFLTRPDANKYYPDILIPVEAIVGSTFTVYSSSSQAIWFDVYVPKNAPAGEYTATINIYEGAGVSTSIPVSMTVYPFTMPDSPPSKTFAELSGTQINLRHYGDQFAAYDGANGPKTSTRLKYMRFLKRFGIMPIGDANDGGCGTSVRTAPCVEYQAAMNGTLYSPTSGYAMAPGVQTKDDIYSMFTYGQWQSTAWTATYDSTCQNANTWVNWFQSNAPHVDYFWYMADEPSDFTNVNRYSTWVTTCPAPGNQLPNFTTANATHLRASAPNITNFATTQALGVPSTCEADRKFYAIRNGARQYYYNGYRPFTGSMLTEDDGVAMRVASWMQYKMKYDGYFWWFSNYWVDENNGGHNTDWMTDSNTFGLVSASSSSVFGRTCFNCQNGDGVLLYPGTDVIVSSNTLGIDGPIPSWRLMMARRGINDFTYLTLAAKYDAKTVDAIVRRIIPQVLWERGVVDINDPTYQYGPVSWSRDPDVWERAREELARIIARGK